MSYTHGQRGQQIGTPGTPLSFATTGIKGASTFFPIFRPIEVQGIAITITTAITVTPAVVAFKYRPIPGSATGEITLGTLTLPVTGSAIGQQVYKKITPVEINPGGEVVIDVTTAATAGAGIAGVIEGATSELPANVAAMIASA